MRAYPFKEFFRGARVVPVKGMGNGFLGDCGFSLTDPVQESPPLTSFVSPCGPATLWGRVQSMCDGLGAEHFKFRPLDKDDALPMVRKACAGEMRWRPSRYTVQPPMSLTRPMS
jgi:hypothetical protein